MPLAQGELHQPITSLEQILTVLDIHLNLAGVTHTEIERGYIARHGYIGVIGEYAVCIISSPV